MNIDLTPKEYRHLLDLVYIGNWILNSIRVGDRFEQYDLIQEKLFSLAKENGLAGLTQEHSGKTYPSRAYENGGIHEAIAEYEDNIFYSILAEELARRDMLSEALNPEDIFELSARIETYITEFEEHGVENIILNAEN